MEELEDTEKAPCIDTDILIDFLRKREPGNSAYNAWRLKSGRTAMVTTVSAFELHLGAELLSSKRSQEVSSLLEHHQILPFDKASARNAARIGAELRKAGKGIEMRDLFNAAICIAHGVPILTRNISHYERIKELQIVSGKDAATG